MLTKRQLRQFHGDNVPLHIIELDYVESVLLKGIYHKTDILVFKGGTCLRKVYCAMVENALSFKSEMNRPSSNRKTAVSPSIFID